MADVAAGYLGHPELDRPPRRRPQLTYNDIPLYYYAEDNEAGDTTGQDVGDVWFVVTPGMQFGDEPHRS